MKEKTKIFRELEKECFITKGQKVTFDFNKYYELKK